MKIVVYSVLDMEKPCYEGLEEKYGVKFVFTNEPPKMKNIKLAHNADAVCIITTPVKSDLVDAFYKEGVRYISTRTIGYDHIDIERAKEIGMGVGNSEYSPDSVAEYTVMLMLMAERNIKTIINSYQNQDFSLNNVQGCLLKNLTVGIIGTGKIGMQVAKMLQVFGCRIIAYSRHEKEEMKGILNYVSLNEIYAESDIISLHMPATDESFHMIDKDVINSMKDKVIIVNTARGSLIDTDALIEQLENGKIGGAALDVIEDETEYYYKEFKNKVIPHRNMAILRSMPNVILTPHTAFHTRQALDEMVKNSIASCIAELNGDENPWKIV
ncbi:D-isomer specific 2-hydroxyacid dehydrogenase family protein [Clostridium saccharobutylicum]|uniref:D-specific alpha-keto acid dehydrogenase n=1 Tax=Clostridium saccharobutylicum TaxID=169679 RepID=A0A1S8NHF0_CLOSA|nr:D-isomer specific 2-hydroxyacid dehydrogenase family protein [Clostridium saccharobutylicum]OOM15772.1 D-specific alpha-keto acid dehydrogenase [Clostridium saccharobutylicum]